jgi:hypothetical protein
MSNRYVGLNQDRHGITQLGRIVLDAQVFGLIPEHEDCAGWDLGRMQALMERVHAEWDRYGNLPSRLPEALRTRHAAIYARAMEAARARGWDPELGDDE